MAMVVMIYGMVVEDGFGALIAFWDVASVFITFGGAFLCVLIMSPSISVYLSYIKSFLLIFKPVATNEGETIKTIIELSNIARKEGLLSLEEAANNIDDEFLKKGVLLIVDGTDPELVRSIMETELGCIEDRHGAVIEFWENLGSMGPAWGMIGTLIGLVNMLKLLDDASAIGPNMAVALITTLYGSLLANWIATPVSIKLKTNSEMEILMKEVMVEGLLSIQAGENPRVIEEKLKSFLIPGKRESLTAEDGENIG